MGCQSGLNHCRSTSETRWPVRCLFFIFFVVLFFIFFLIGHVIVNDYNDYNNNVCGRQNTVKFNFSERSDQVVKDPRSWLLRHYATLGLLTEEQLADMQAWDGQLETWNAGLKFNAVFGTYLNKDQLMEGDARLLYLLKTHSETPFAFQFAARLMYLRQQFIKQLATDKKKKDERARLGHDLFRIVLCQTALSLQTKQQQGTAKQPPAKTPPVLLPFEGFLHYFNTEIQQCSFWTAQANRLDPVVQTLNKALPQRCQTRDGGETTLSKFASNTTFSQAYSQWLDCSLLGMYSHSTYSLSTLRVLEFMQIMSTAEQRRAFYMWLLQRQDLLCIFVSREYLMYVLPQQPSLLDVIKKNFCWERFTSLCVQAMAGVRFLVDRHGWPVLFVGDHVPSPAAAIVLKPRKRKRQSSSSSSSSSDEDGSGGTQQHAQVLKSTTDQFNRLCQDWLDRPVTHDPPSLTQDATDLVPDPALFEIRDKTTEDQQPVKFAKFTALLRRVWEFWQVSDHRLLPRRFAALLEYLDKAEKDRQESSNKPEEKKPRKRKSGRQTTEDLLILLRQQQGFTGLFYDRQQPSFWQQVFSTRGKVPPTSIVRPAGVKEDQMMSRGITRSHYEQLESWIAKCIDYDENKAVQMLVSFGMPKSTLDKVRLVKKLYDTRRYGRKQVSIELLQWKIKYPYSYALLHCFAFLWRRHMELRVHELPMHYLQSQLTAIRGRYGLRPTDPIPDTATRLTVCTVCRHVFTLHSTRVKKLNPNEAFGFQKVTVDIRTNIMYCSRTSVADHIDFKHCALKYLPLLGRVLEFNRKLWILCPQPGCGQPFVLNPDPLVSLYNEHGYGCQWCTLKARDPEHYSDPRAKSIVKQTSKTQQQKNAARAKAKAKAKSNAAAAIRRYKQAKANRMGGRWR
jgi:hypothetical protein